MTKQYTIDNLEKEPESPVILLNYRQKQDRDNSNKVIFTYSTLRVFKAPTLGDKDPLNPIFGSVLQINNKTKHMLSFSII